MNIYDQALEVIRERGMCKLYMEDNGHYCIYGALWVASGKAVRGDEFLDAVAETLFPQRIRDGVNQPWWRANAAATANNHPDTTQEDVELILKHASYEWELLHG